MHKYLHISLGDLAREMEREHALILEELGRLEAMAASGDVAVADDALLRLIEYALEHFMREEGAMRQIGLVEDGRARFAAHVEDHANMMETLRRIASEKPAQQQIVDVARFVRRWVEDHIRRHDVELLGYLPKGLPVTA